MSISDGTEPGGGHPPDPAHLAAFLATIIESSDDAIISKELDGTITTWSGGAERIYGYTADEIVGHNISVITPSDRLDELEDVLARIGNGERIEHHETKRVHKDGTELDISLTVSPIRDPAGIVVGASAIGRDITDRLSQERERFRALLDAAPDAIIGVDASGKIEFASERVERIFGWRADDLISQQIEVLVPESIKEAHVAHRASYVAKPYPRQMGAELQLFGRRKDGTTFPVDISLSTFTNTGGGLLVLATVRDVTETRRRERDIQEREVLFNQFARSTNVGIIVREGSRLLYANPGVFRISGINPNSPDATLANLRSKVHPDDLDTAMNVIAAGDRGDTDRTEMRVIHPNGEVRWIQNTQVPMPRTKGDPLRIASTVIDITAQKHAEAAARTAQTEAEQANAAKTEFLSRMSHELRTPLNAILGFGQLLEMDEIGSEQRDSVRHIVRAGEHLLGLIDEVLDIARMERGAMRLSLEAVNMSDVIDEAIGMLRPIAERRDIRLVVDSDGPSVHVRADRQRLKQVFVNLLANAVKYNRDGGKVRIESELRESERLRLTVSDTGIGIAEEDISRLFQPFERLAAEQSNVEGTGLGLALTRNLMAAMKGEVGVTSRIGEGSSFWVELPITDAPSLERRDETRRALETPPPLSSGPKTVLYIEDNLSNVRLIERIATRRPNINLMVAMQGRIAIDMAREHHPDLVLLDLHLPDISGEDVLLGLRADPRTADIPVVIVSADATTGRPNRLLAQGATSFLTKPFNIPRLLEVFDKLGESRRPGIQVINAKDTPSDQRLSIPDVTPVSEPSIAHTDQTARIIKFVHDFNTELGVILNYSALLLEGATDPSVEGDLRIIQVSVEHALELTKQFRSMAE